MAIHGAQAQVPTHKNQVALMPTRRVKAQRKLNAAAPYALAALAGGGIAWALSSRNQEEKVLWQRSRK